MKVITGNRLLDGEVVWMGENGSWVELLSLAKILHEKNDVADAMALAKKSLDEQVMVDAYEIDVKEEDGRVVPVRLRELIRAAGPTTHPHLGKQARPTLV
ncbi:DUF2849 domain-containing protein [Roseibium limicola]|uniref:DUF2849 domain-containing protein n=1 Tax=Roseibium limicola TaxID=2816037 RepID=A0A939ENP8_9HYPH|nr:DUF2849 domain-containing protein [Roseibium limicola]MBO0345777.1 DUF2849 domain-containing protein [Roseibium limicola]